MKADFKRIIRMLVVITLMVALIVALSSCGFSPNHTLKKFKIISVNGEQYAAPLGPASIHMQSMGGDGGNVDSGPPDYIKVTLKKIELDGDFGRVTIWDGGTNGEEITIGGSGAVDLSGISPMNTLPTGHANDVRVTFSYLAKIKGSLTNAYFTDTSGASGSNLYTKSDYYYDGHNGVNTYYHNNGGTYVAGGVSYTNFTSPAQETIVTISGDENTPDWTEGTVITPIDSDINANSQLTILFDTSRMLRFYDGYGSTDVDHYATFFSDSVFRRSIACFIGNVGEIQGYQTYFTAQGCPPGDHEEYVRGWMTLIFDPNGNFLSGMMIGDDDNALCVAKGDVTTLDSEAGTLTYVLDTNTFNITSGFQKLTNYGDSCSVVWTSDANDGGYIRHGIATLTLKYPAL